MACFNISFPHNVDANCVWHQVMWKTEHSKHTILNFLERISYSGNIKVMQQRLTSFVLYFVMQFI
jgi:hypothetical protein